MRWRTMMPSSDPRVEKFIEAQRRGAHNFHKILILEADADAEVIPQRVQCRYCERLNLIAERCDSCGAPPAPWPAEAPPPLMLLSMKGGHNEL